MGKKKFLLIIPIIGIVVFAYLYFTVLSPPVTVAELIIDSGTVQVMHPGGDWIQGQNGMLLGQGDSVRTLEASEAAIIFFESSILRLGPETEIEIQKLDPTPDSTYIEIKQELGQTWNKILKLSGIDSYQVETPTTVASVRGTGFSIKVLTDGETEVKLMAGELNTSTYRLEAGKKKILSRLALKKEQMVRVKPAELEAPLKALAIIRDEFIERNALKDEEFIQNVKTKLLKRFSTVLPLIRDRYGLTQQQVEQGFDKYLRGEEVPEIPPIVTRILERRASVPQLLTAVTTGEVPAPTGEAQPLVPGEPQTGPTPEIREVTTETGETAPTTMVTQETERNTTAVISQELTTASQSSSGCRTCGSAGTVSESGSTSTLDAI